VLLFYFYFLIVSFLLTGDITGRGRTVLFHFFLVGTFSSPETLPGGGQLCFSSTLLRGLARGPTRSFSGSLSPSAPTHLDMTNSTRASTVPVEKFTVNTSLLTEILPHLEDNRQLILGRKCGRQGLYVKCWWYSLFAPPFATLLECGNFRSPRSGYLGRGYQYPLTILSFYFFTGIV